VVANLEGNGVSVLLGIGDGTFATKAGYGTGSYPRAVVIGDMNLDGRPDLAVTNSGSNSVAVLLNIGSTTGVDPTPRLPLLASPRPNPFRSSVSLTFDVANAGPVRLEVFDLQGRSVSVLQAGMLEAGRYTRTWDGTDRGGSAARTGMYIARFSGPDVNLTRKLLLVR
jgi:hypothetical protein